MQGQAGPPSRSGVHNTIAKPESFGAAQKPPLKSTSSGKYVVKPTNKNVKAYMQFKEHAKAIWNATNPELNQLP